MALHAFRRLVCSHCGQVLDVPIYCGNRFCPVCSKVRSSKIRKKLNSVIELIERRDGFTFKHLTLSTVSIDDLESQIKFLIASFRRLRQRAFWKSKVAGGAYVIEITGTPGKWHAHFHCIIYSRYMKWDKLHKQWNNCSGGLSVYIQNIFSRRAVNYMTKYLTKTDLNPALHIQVSIALKSLRLVSMFGEWHNLVQQVRKDRPICWSCGKGEFELLNVYTSEPIWKTFYKEIDDRVERGDAITV